MAFYTRIEDVSDFHHEFEKRGLGNSFSDEGFHLIFHCYNELPYLEELDPEKIVETHIEVDLKDTNSILEYAYSDYLTVSDIVDSLDNDLKFKINDFDVAGKAHELKAYLKENTDLVKDNLLDNEIEINASKIKPLLIREFSVRELLILLEDKIDFDEIHEILIKEIEEENHILAMGKNYLIIRRL